MVTAWNIDSSAGSGCTVANAPPPGFLNCNPGSGCWGPIRVASKAGRDVLKAGRAVSKAAPVFRMAWPPAGRAGLPVGRVWWKAGSRVVPVFPKVWLRVGKDVWWIGPWFAGGCCRPCSSCPRPFCTHFRPCPYRYCWPGRPAGQRAFRSGLPSRFCSPSSDRRYWYLSGELPVSGCYRCCWKLAACSNKELAWDPKSAVPHSSRPGIPCCSHGGIRSDSHACTRLAPTIPCRENASRRSSSQRKPRRKTPSRYKDSSEH